MKSRLILSLLLVMIMLFEISCSYNEEKTVTSDSSKTEKVEEPKKVSNSSNQDNNQTNENLTVGTGVISVYYANEEETGFTSENIVIETLSPDSVFNTLISKGVVTADVNIESFMISKIDNKKSIDIDLNQAFVTYVSALGTTAEYYTVGGICNTFLEAYDCEQIRITIEGDEFVTAHAEYPGYLTKFE